MSDLRFDDVVETTRMIGYDGRYAKSTCKSCSEQRRVSKEEFRLDNFYNLDGSKVIPRDVDIDVLEYVAGMRAWNCCHEGQKPLDGFPEEPDVRHVEFDE